MAPTLATCHAKALLACVCAAATIMPASIGNAYEIFDYPLVEGMPMDGCLAFAQDCEHIAADYFCAQRGYSEASDWYIEDSPTNTMTLRTHEVCDISRWICGRFVDIECEDRQTALDPSILESLTPIIAESEEILIFSLFRPTDNDNSPAYYKESVFARISNLQSGASEPADEFDEFMLAEANPDGIVGSRISYLFDSTWGDNLGVDSRFNTVWDNYGNPGLDGDGVFEVISVADEGGTLRATTNTAAYYFSYDALNDGLGDAVTIDEWIDYVQEISLRYGRIDELTIFTHGNSGLLAMSDSFRLTLEAIESDQGTRGQLMRLRNVLGDGATILLFSCQVARDGSGDNRGTRFIQELANLTGATVFANRESTGPATAGNADWVLDAVAVPR